MDPEDMPAVNFKKESDKFSTIQRHYIKKISDYNIERVAKFHVQKKRARILGCGLGLTAFSIYLYTMYAVRQETFLDDFEIPESMESQVQ